jgi:hypothetical protein
MTLQELQTTDRDEILPIAAGRGARNVLRVRLQEVSGNLSRTC